MRDEPAVTKPPLEPSDFSFGALRRPAEIAIVEAFRGFGCSVEELAAYGVTVEDVKRMALTLRWKFFRPEQIKESLDGLWRDNLTCNNINPSEFAASLKWFTLNGFPPACLSITNIPKGFSGYHGECFGDEVFGVDPHFDKDMFLSKLSERADPENFLGGRTLQPSHYHRLPRGGYLYKRQNSAGSLVLPLGLSKLSDDGKVSPLCNHFGWLRDRIYEGSWCYADDLDGKKFTPKWEPFIFSSPYVSRVVITREGFYYTESAWAVLHGYTSQERKVYSAFNYPHSVVKGFGIRVVRGTDMPDNHKPLAVSGSPPPGELASYYPHHDYAAEMLASWWTGIRGFIR